MRTRASAGTCSPARNTRTSSRTTSPGATSTSSPSRRTSARGAFISARRSSADFARNSCTHPMIAFANAASPKRASCHRPTRNNTKKQAKTMPLKRVNTFARTMLHALRLVSATNALVLPAATRSATSVLVRPLVGGSEVLSTDLNIERPGRFRVGRDAIAPEGRRGVVIVLPPRRRKARLPQFPGRGGPHSCVTATWWSWGESNPRPTLSLHAFSGRSL